MRIKINYFSQRKKTLYTIKHENYFVKKANSWNSSFKGSKLDAANSNI